MNWPRLNITPNGIFYQNRFYKHSSYDFFECYKNSISFYKSFNNNDRRIFTINNLDEDEVTQIIKTLM